MKTKIKRPKMKRTRKRILTQKEKTIKLKPKKRVLKLKLTSKQKLLEIIRDKNILLKELLENIKNKKELFRDLQDLTDARVIGFSETAGRGVKYFLK